MFTLLSHICMSITGSPLPDGIFDDYFFYQLRTKKKISGDILDWVTQIGKHTPYQLAILGIPSEESISNIEKIFYGKKFSNYFFKGGRPSHISMMKESVDYGIQEGYHCISNYLSVTLYFEEEGMLDSAGHRIYQNGTHPKKGYSLHPRKVGFLSECSCCGKFLPLVSEKFRLRTFSNAYHGDETIRRLSKNHPNLKCSLCENNSHP